MAQIFGWVTIVTAYFLVLVISMVIPRRVVSRWCGTKCIILNTMLLQMCFQIQRKATTLTTQNGTALRWLWKRNRLGISEPRRRNASTLSLELNGGKCIARNTDTAVLFIEAVIGGWWSHYFKGLFTFKRQILSTWEFNFSRNCNRRPIMSPTPVKTFPWVTKLEVIMT